MEDQVARRNRTQQRSANDGGSQYTQIINKTNVNIVLNMSHNQPDGSTQSTNNSGNFIPNEWANQGVEFTEEGWSNSSTMRTARRCIWRILRTCATPLYKALRKVGWFLALGGAAYGIMRFLGSCNSCKNA